MRALVKECIVLT